MCFLWLLFRKRSSIHLSYFVSCSSESSDHPKQLNSLIPPDICQTVRNFWLLHWCKIRGFHCGLEKYSSILHLWTYREVISYRQFGSAYRFCMQDHVSTKSNCSA
jgi:hypothetical protein